MGRNLALFLTNDLSELGWVNGAVEEFLEELGVEENARYAVHLTLEEILTNIIKYAYPHGARQEISVRVSPERTFLALHFEDTGCAFDPSSAPPADTSGPIEERRVGGLGIHLVRAFSDQVLYRRTGDHNHLEVRIPREPHS